MTREEYFMSQAIILAKEAAEVGEVPVGAVVVLNDEIISKGYNMRETLKNALCHAETIAINNACSALGGWRLWQCELFVTLEPCPMCAGAIINSRIKKVYFGAYDRKNGSVSSLVNLFDLPYSYKPIYIGGILKDECSVLLSDFFKNLRKKNATEKDEV